MYQGKYFLTQRFFSNCSQFIAVENNSVLTPKYVMNALSANPKLNIYDNSLHIPLTPAANKNYGLAKANIGSGSGTSTPSRNSEVPRRKERGFTIIAQEFNLNDLLAIPQELVPVPSLTMPTNLQIRETESLNFNVISNEVSLAKSLSDGAISLDPVETSNTHLPSRSESQSSSSINLISSNNENRGSLSVNQPSDNRISLLPKLPGKDNTDMQNVPKKAQQLLLGNDDSSKAKSLKSVPGLDFKSLKILSGGSKKDREPHPLSNRPLSISPTSPAGVQIRPATVKETIPIEKNHISVQPSSLKYSKFHSNENVNNPNVFLLLTYLE